MNLTPVENITTIDKSKLLVESSEIISKIESTWAKDKQFLYMLPKQKRNIGVQTYHANSLNGVHWSARVSDFKDFDSTAKSRYFKLLQKYILGSFTNNDLTHTHYEKEYIHELYDYDINKFDTPDNESASYLVQLFYKFQFPLKKRVFYEYVHVFKEDNSNDAYVVSLPISPKLLEKSEFNKEYVVGRYTSIEKISYDAESNDLKWIMCTCSTPGGSIPDWLTNMTINGAIAKDVPSFLNWVDTLEK
ncbi:hypothetical protein PICST_62209 [Scheffersomyces stipitis CBS 6054]|uniref:DUF3074 domain-containing protein n=1 Tax=Scheffersomyces stipitis (strain ATCC 58785 / CBS 6054 / NBRC 10063 / NRRL Y-11545) TaxID=322104 RepID=A3LXM1_PICST|nr:hypothetical protein PICST_62209 [Scheffersomyces stipitis CBS 6054]ABN67488.2 hypothetical protein PICST_62209 [Scheffersomyces stipitis CBS 6054]KAG2732259.1 hypothetical protein G9P44_004676 [Scheffersomyces stipitis]